MKLHVYALALIALAGCSDDASEDACEAERAFLDSHRACNADTDCAIVGSCSGGFGFNVVNTSARAKAQSLSDNTSCGRAFDGPLYSAACVQGQCAMMPTGAYCGMARDTGIPMDAKIDAQADATSDAVVPDSSGP